MKKLAIALAVVAMAAGSASAQRVVNNPDNKPFWGVRASLDISCPTKTTVKDGDFKESEKLLNNGVGFSVGAIYHLPIVANFYFEPGVSLFYNTWSDKLDSDEKDDYKHNSYRQTGIRIPLNLGYHFDFTDDFKLSVFTGPQVQVGFSCDNYQTLKDEWKWEWSDGGESKHQAPSMYSGDNGFNRFNMSWNVGVGFTFKQMYLGVTGSLEMTNMMRIKNKPDNYDITTRMNTVGIALGYNF